MQRGIVLLIVVCLFLGGCAIEPPPTNNREDNTVTQCLSWLQEKEGLDHLKFEQLPDDQKGYAFMHQQTMQMISRTFGEQPCAQGTNEHDAYIAYVQEQGKTNRKYSSDAAGVAKVGIVTTGVVEGLDAIAGAVGARYGDGAVHVDGDQNSVVKGDTTKTTTTTEGSQVAGQGQEDITNIPTEQTEVDSNIL